MKPKHTFGKRASVRRGKSRKNILPSDSAGAAKIALSALNKVRLQALAGDERAMMHVIEIGNKAAEAVQDIYHDLHPSLFGVSEEAARELRRVKLQTIARSGVGIPTITRFDEQILSWDDFGQSTRLQKLPRAPSRTIRRQDVMLADIRPVEFKPRYGRAGQARYVYHELIRRVWLGVRFGFRPEPNEERNELEKLEELTRKNASKWAAAIRDLLWRKHEAAIKQPGTWWHRLAVEPKDRKRALKDWELKDGIYQLFLKVFRGIAEGGGKTDQPDQLFALASRVRLPLTKAPFPPEPRTGKVKNWDIDEWMSQVPPIANDRANQIQARTNAVRAALRAKTVHP